MQRMPLLQASLTSVVCPAVNAKGIYASKASSRSGDLGCCQEGQRQNACHVAWCVLHGILLFAHFSGLGITQLERAGT